MLTHTAYDPLVLKEKLMLGSRILIFLTAAALAVCAFGQAPQQPIPAPLSSQPTAIASDAPVGPRDVVEIHVFQDSNLNVRATVTSLWIADAAAICKPKVDAVLATSGETATVTLTMRCSPAGITSGVMRLKIA